MTDDALKAKAAQMACEAQNILTSIARKELDKKHEAREAERREEIDSVPREEKLFVIDYVCRMLRTAKYTDLLFDPDDEQGIYDLTCDAHAAYRAHKEREKENTGGSSAKGC